MARVCRCVFFLTPKSFPRFLLLLIPTCSYNKILQRVLDRVLLLLILHIYIFLSFFSEHYNFQKVRR